MSRNSIRKHNRRTAVSFIVEQMGNDVFSTTEVWLEGHKMIEDGITFPRYAKNAFKGINRCDDLGQVIRGHPDFEFDHEVDEMFCWNGSRSKRVRSKVWIRR